MDFMTLTNQTFPDEYDHGETNATAVPQYTGRTGELNAATFAIAKRKMTGDPIRDRGQTNRRAQKGVSGPDPTSKFHPEAMHAHSTAAPISIPPALRLVIGF